MSDDSMKIAIATGKRFQKYFWTIVAVAFTGVICCIASAGIAWGLVISFTVVPVFCLFAAGIISIVEVCAQRKQETREE